MIPKFRAWDKEHEEMLYPDDEDKIFFEVTVYGMNTLDMRVDPDEYGGFSYLNTVIMQSTGLHDKNGVEIYEGDVVKDDLLTDRKEDIFVIEREVNYFVAKLILSGTVMNNVIEPMMFGNHAYMKGVEVISNIHENPELLEDVE